MCDSISLINNYRSGISQDTAQRGSGPQNLQQEEKMRQIGFSAEKYIEEQSKYILQRIEDGEGKRLYLEFGGKLVQDKHAMRVLPGFDENAKIKLLQRMKDQAEIIICIYSGDITTSKTRQDFGITYDLEVLRLIDVFRKYDLEIGRAHV